MTSTKAFVVSLIPLGYRNLAIAEEVTNKFDLLGREQDELPRHIENTRREISDFREKAPALAELGFEQGYGWPEVVAALEGAGLLSSLEVTNICVAARSKVQAEPSDQTLPAVDNKALNQHLIEAALKVNPQDSVLQTTLESIREEQAEREERGW